MLKNKKLKINNNVIHIMYNLYMIEPISKTSLIELRSRLSPTPTLPILMEGRLERQPESNKVAAMISFSSLFQSQSNYLLIIRFNFCLSFKKVSFLERKMQAIVQTSLYSLRKKPCSFSLLNPNPVVMLHFSTG